MGLIGHENRLENCTKAAKALAQKVADRIDGYLVIRHGSEGNVFHAVEQQGSSVAPVAPDALEGIECKYDGVSRFEAIAAKKKESKK